MRGPCRRNKMTVRGQADSRQVCCPADVPGPEGPPCSAQGADKRAKLARPSPGEGSAFPFQPRQGWPCPDAEAWSPSRPSAAPAVVGLDDLVPLEPGQAGGGHPDPAEEKGDWLLFARTDLARTANQRSHAMLRTTQCLPAKSCLSPFSGPAPKRAKRGQATFRPMRPVSGGPRGQQSPHSPGQAAPRRKVASPLFAPLARELGDPASGRGGDGAAVGAAGPTGARRR